MQTAPAPVEIQPAPSPAPAPAAAQTDTETAVTKKFHLATMTHDAASNLFTVKCQEPGCPMSEGAGADVHTPHNLYNKNTRGPHGFDKLTNWAMATGVMLRDGSFDTICNVAFKHHRLPNGGPIKRTNTAEIREFMVRQLSPVTPDAQRVIEVVDGAATIQYRVNTGEPAKRRITPEPVVGVAGAAARVPPPAPKKPRLIIERDAGMPPEARALLEEFKANARSSKAVAQHFAHAAPALNQTESEPDESYEPDASEPDASDSEVMVSEPDEADQVDDASADLVDVPAVASADLVAAVLRSTSKVVSLLADHVGESQAILEAVRTNALLQQEALEHV